FLNCLNWNMIKWQNNCIKHFLSLLKPYKKKIFFALASILLVNLSSLAFPWVIKVVIDDVLAEKNLRLINLLTAGLAVIFAVRLYFEYIREYLVSFVGEKVVCDLRQKLYIHLHRLSVRYVEDTPAGKIISGLIGDVESIRKFLFDGAIDFLYSFFSIFFVLAILFIMDWRLTLVSLIYLPIFGITFFKLTPRLKERHGAIRDKYAELTTRISEVLNGIRIVAGLNREAYEADRFDLKQKEIFNISIKGHKLGVFLWAMSEFMSSMGLVTLIWFGARAVISGRITMGTLMAFYSYLGMLFFPVVKLVVVNNYYQEAAASMDRINEVLETEPEIKESPRAVSLDNIEGNVKFSGITFGYNDKREVLSGIDFEVKRPEIAALVGKSGAGKTTIINLLLRFYDPAEGEIFIDGHRLKDLKLSSYRSKVAMVLQDDYLFSATIRENIMYGKPDASLEEVIRVAKSANAHRFIIELPEGYDTQAGERGIKLSYGQRQRISIARAIIRDPAILILDEATSSVDSETERLIIEQAFRNLMSGRTTFIIAHRLSTIGYADKIMFLEGGRIVECGKHEELLDIKGRYWRMWTEQRAENYKCAA
ncbi:MAG: ABC transporter ATP-binding protein/permease, partial [Candidatus Omnitrophica bacterium]|nr:ABC transporter ATP-binding protein/permease [Candidatus Omnitrophota bacterium]